MSRGIPSSSSSSSVGERVVAGPRRFDGVAVLVASASIGLFGVFGHLMVTQYRRFGLNAFDLAIFDQGVWLLAHLKEPFVTVRGLHLFADHSSYVLIPFAAIYRILPYQETLILTSIAVMAIGAPLAYWAARAIGASRPLAATVAIGYLMHPAVSWNARDSFHPEQFVLPLLLGAFILVARRKDGWAIAVVLLALTTKEDAALIAVPFGLLVWWWFGRRRAGLLMVALSTAALLANFAVLLPHFSPTGALLYSSRYAHLGQGPIGAAVGLLTHPRVVVDALTDPWHLGYLVALVLPIPLALREPRALAMAIPAVAANLVSAHTYQALINYHYTVYPLTAVLIAGVLGSATASRWTAKAKKAVIAASAAAALVFLPMSAAFGEWAEPPADTAHIEQVLTLIPHDASVSAWYRYVPHLTHRVEIYEFPNPWTRMNYAAPGLPMPDPSSVEWVLARRDDNFSDVEQLLSDGTFRIVRDTGPVLLLRRVDANPSNSD